MKNKINFLFLLIGLSIFNITESHAEGISVDAGLTPAQDRIIIRWQYRHIINEMGGNQLVMHMMPVVIAYGLSPNITLIMRNGYSVIGTNETIKPMQNRWMDPFLMGKMKLFRYNSRNYVIGLAAHAGSSFPLLKNSFSDTYSPIVGISASYRLKYWSFDYTSSYEWVNYNSKEKQSESRQFQMNLAISRNLILRKLNNLVLAPVQEFSIIRNNPGTGDVGFFGFLSPGFQLISPHIKLEALYQFAINPSSISSIKYGNRFILGMRFMF
ncbi:MAG: hypothetical protein PF484_05350 [Bacteroidales bacterium]|jgi:hypothetical protein|nr:hypothetical protein [Bacteroidales bacterium]